MSQSVSRVMLVAVLAAGCETVTEELVQQNPTNPLGTTPVPVM